MTIISSHSVVFELIPDSQLDFALFQKEEPQTLMNL